MTKFEYEMAYQTNVVGSREAFDITWGYAALCPIRVFGF